MNKRSIVELWLAKARDDERIAFVRAFATFRSEDGSVREAIFDHELDAHVGDAIVVVSATAEATFVVMKVSRMMFERHLGRPNTLVQLVDYEEVPVSAPTRKLPTRKKRTR